MAALLVIIAIVFGLVMIPFGMPGTLVIFAAALCYYLLVPHGAIGLFTVIVMGAMMVVAEGLEWVLTARFTKRYGGSPSHSSSHRSDSWLVSPTTRG